MEVGPEVVPPPEIEGVTHGVLVGGDDAEFDAGTDAWLREGRGLVA